jgi:hypothetical protein
MNGLYPIIRRRRRPLLEVEGLPAGGGQTGRGQGAVAGGEVVTPPPGTLPKLAKNEQAAGLKDRRREDDVHAKTQAG